MTINSHLRCRFLICIILGVFLAGAPLLAFGQTENLSDSLSLERTVKLFITNNPNIVRARTAATRQSELAQTSALWPNPSVEFEQERTGMEKTQTAFIDQPILNPVEYGARKKSANAQRKAAFASYREEAADLYFELRKKYVTAVSAQSKLRVVQQLIETVRRAIDIIQVRYEEGTARSFEINRLKTALADYENRLAQRKVERDEAYTALISFIAPEESLQNIGESSRMVLTDTLGYQAANYSLNKLLQEAFQTRGLLASLESLTRANRNQLSAEKAARFPDLSIRGGVVREFALTSPTAPFFGIGIGVPLWNNNGHQIKASQADLNQSQALLNIARRQVRREVLTAYNTFTSYKDRIEQINETLLKTDQGLVKDALYLYSEGEITLVELLDAVSASLDSQLLKLELLTQYQISRYKIAQVTGQIPDVLVSTN